MKEFDKDDEQGRERSAKREMVDQFGNIFYIKEKLSDGGQGIVYRTTDCDLAIKQPIVRETGELDFDPSLSARYSRIRTLPLPKGCRVTMPLSILRGQPGYVMRLLDGMKDFSGVFEFGGKEIKSLDAESIPAWLSNIEDRRFALQLLHYARTGGARARMEALFLSAALLARLHLNGLVYGDVSPKNIFIGRRQAEAGYDFQEAWLIDIDNLRLERTSGGGWTFTGHLGAPEVRQGKRPCSTRTDTWSFAVMAFELLTLANPFIGRQVAEAEEEDCDWANDANSAAGTEMSLEEKAYAGLLPYVYDPDDDSNGYVGGGLPLEIVSSSGIRRLFLETFGPGRLAPHRRPNLAFWALELARAYDQSLMCPGCGMSYLAKENTQCPFCDRPRPAFMIAKMEGRHWEKVFAEDEKKVRPLPHRLFHPFSLAHCADVEYAAEIDFKRCLVRPLRGWNAFPVKLKFEFVSSADKGKEVAS